MSSDELFADEIDAPGPSGGQMLLALIGLFAFVLVIVGLVALGGWAALVAAVAVMIVGAFAVTRYVQTISSTATSGGRGVSGIAAADDTHSEISRHDIPLGEPERNAAAATSEDEHS
jgi:hypothetical protein